MIAPFPAAVSTSTTGRWFGPTGDTSFGWLTRSSSPSRCGVVIVPPFGYEYWTSHRALRVLAESLAAQGFLVLRLDLRGTGDARGDLWSGAVMSTWHDDIAEAVAEVRRAGADSVSLVGLRLGGLLALSSASALSVDRVIAWAAVTDGKRYARELSMLSTQVPDDENVYGHALARTLAGTVLTDTFLADVASASSRTLGKPAREVLVLDRDDRPASSALVQRLRDNAVEVEHQVCGGAGSMLDVPTEEATVPVGHVARIVEYLAPIAATADEVETDDSHRSGVVLGEHGISEAVTTLGPHRLAAVISSPVPSRSTGVTVVFLNTGSESHVGSGRVWVEFSRALAAEGTTAVRLDFLGWGESPDEGHAPGRPYDGHTVHDVVDAVTALRQSGHERIVLVGICAGAWIGLRAARSSAVDGVVAFNPQLYWQEGDPVEALMSDTRKRRADEIAAIAAGAVSGEWDRLEAGAPLCAPGRWLEELATSAFPVVLAFSPNDDGLEYLENRFGARLHRAQSRSGSPLSVVRMASLDHPMHAHHRRHEGLNIIRSLVQDLA